MVQGGAELQACTLYPKPQTVTDREYNYAINIT